MDYELAKKLKEAGFPSSHTDGPPFDFGGGLGHYWYAPTLSELIEACGEGYISLERLEGVGRGWIACKAPPERDDFGGDEISGDFHSTPEEAVARLWLEFHKK